MATMGSSEWCRFLSTSTTTTAIPGAQNPRYVTSITHPTRAFPANLNLGKSFQYGVTSGQFHFTQEELNSITRNGFTGPRPPGSSHRRPTPSPGLSACNFSTAVATKRGYLVLPLPVVKFRYCFLAWLLAHSLALPAMLACANSPRRRRTLTAPAAAANPPAGPPAPPGAEAASPGPTHTSGPEPFRSSERGLTATQNVPSAPSRPAGETRYAQTYSDNPQPRIPRALLDSGLKTSVRAIFQISADGSFTVALQGTTGKPELDEAVLKTLRQWRWQDGVPCPTTQKVRVDFLVD